MNDKEVNNNYNVPLSFYNFTRQDNCLFQLQNDNYYTFCIINTFNSFNFFKIEETKQLITVNY